MNILRSKARSAIMLTAVCWATLTASGQGMHFSQYYNAPLLLNPANTALTPDADYRVGANYRDQWGSVPVPYKTMSAWADFRTLQNREGSNWLGLGAAFFSDRAGDGNLALTRFEATAAYHLKLGEYNMLSVGASAAYVQRSVDFAKLTFDRQWDGLRFNRSMASGELPGLKKTSYGDIAAGVNWAYFPNDDLYLKFGAGLAHLNNPKETFYNNTNALGLRPTLNADAVIRTSPGTIINPSVYYTSQKEASELVYGTMFITALGKEGSKTALILGAYNRWNDAVIAAVGLDIASVRIMGTYDVTISKLGAYNNRAGAVEFGIYYSGLYGNSSNAPMKKYGCPRLF